MARAKFRLYLSPHCHSVCTSSVYLLHECLMYCIELNVRWRLHFYWVSLVSDSKDSVCNVGELGFDPWVGKIRWRGERLPTSAFLPGGFHGQRSLAGFSPWVAKSWTQLSYSQFHFHSSLGNFIAVSHSENTFPE